MDGGIAVTASHNPKDYNGMKFVREESRPISGDTGLFDIQAMAEQDQFVAAATPGKLEVLDTSAAYIQHLLSYVDVAALKPLKIVVDAGNGGAGRVVDLLEPHLPRSSSCITSLTATSPMACQIRWYRKIARQR